MQEAHCAFIEENYEKAIRYYTKMLNENLYIEKHDECRFGRAKAYLKSNKQEEAIADFKLLVNSQFASLTKKYLDQLEKSTKLIKENVLKTNSSSKSKEIPMLSDKVRSSEIIRNKWIQNSTQVILTLYKKNLDPEKVIVYFQPKQLVVDLELENKKIHRRSAILTQPISIQNSSWIVTQYKVIITLGKIKPMLWDSFEILDNQTKSNQVGESLNVKKFDSLKEALEKEEEDEKDNGNPNAALMNMMGKLYREGDDDMKRMIAKTWTEGQEKKNLRH